MFKCIPRLILINQNVWMLRCQRIPGSVTLSMGWRWARSSNLQIGFQILGIKRTMSLWTLKCDFLFSNAFKLDAEEEHREVFKSLGIDKEGGFVFSIDTMQVFFFRKKTHFQLILPKNNVNLFISGIRDNQAASWIPAAPGMRCL